MSWYEIAVLERAPDLLLAYAPPDDRFPDGRMMIWSRDLLARNLKGTTPNHLQFPATHWIALPPPPFNVTPNAGLEARGAGASHSKTLLGEEGEK